jgi:hypothetical protein
MIGPIQLSRITVKTLQADAFLGFQMLKKAVPIGLPLPCLPRDYGLPSLLSC